MAWTAPRTWVVGEILTGALLNTHLRDNLLETAVAKVTTAGDIVQATAANALARLGMSGAGGKFLRANAGATALEYAAVADVADSLQWANKVTDRYMAQFAGEQGGTAVLTGVTALQGAGWSSNGADILPAAATVAAGDMNSASDDDDGYFYISASTGYMISPRIIGGYSRLQALAKLKGATQTTITVGIMARADVTTADAADAFGLANDYDAAVGTAGMIAILNGATNFEYRNGAAAAVSLGVAKDTSYHLFEFVISIAGMTMDIKIDGTVRATAVALAQDEWPKGIWLKGASNVVEWRMPECWVFYD